MTETAPKKQLSTSTVLNILAILVPFAYLAGYFYDNGYLSAYGFPPNAFPKSFEIYLVSFFIAITSLIVRLMSLMNSGSTLLFIFLFVTAVGVMIAISDRFTKNNKEAIDKVKVTVKNFRHLDITLFPLILGTFSVLFPFTVLALLGFLVLGLYSGYIVGQDAAVRELKQFSCEPSSNCSKLYKDGVLVAEGKVIATSDTFIGIYTEDGAQLIPNSNITFKNHTRHDRKN